MSPASTLFLLYNCARKPRAISIFSHPQRASTSYLYKPFKMFFKPPPTNNLSNSLLFYFSFFSLFFFYIISRTINILFFAQILQTNVRMLHKCRWNLSFPQNGLQVKIYCMGIFFFILDLHNIVTNLTNFYFSCVQLNMHFTFHIHFNFLVIFTTII